MAGNHTCDMAQWTLYGCANALSLFYPNQVEVGLQLIEAAGYVTNPCGPETIMWWLGNATETCTNVCDFADGQCQQILSSLYQCAPYVGFDDAMAIGMLGQQQQNCMTFPDWTVADCEGVAIETTLGEFMAACDACDPSGDMGACMMQVCAGQAAHPTAAATACWNAYAAVDACFLQVDAENEMAVAMTVNMLHSIGQSCAVTASDCDVIPVTLALQELQMVCNCSDAPACLAKAEDCSLLAIPACVASAQALLTQCGQFAAALPQNLQVIFSAAGPALEACLAPTCNADYVLTGPLQIQQDVACCDATTGKGKYGLNGGCCLRNPDMTSPDMYVDTTVDPPKPCCYHVAGQTDVGACGTTHHSSSTGENGGTITGGAASIGAGVATLIATAAALLL